MLLKKITLDNIRSYENSEVEFPTGSLLLSGDIGSGKTSILLAIEFGLFGLQPGQRGSSLLRNGKETGGVTLEFEVDNHDIIIKRTLKKSKTISQDYCSITIDGVKSELSVTELKNRVLTLLNYPKEFSKKQNILYKFTVYTPQEEMKQIILQDPDTRINTLRHVFGIDKYKKILENVSLLISKLREERRIKIAITETFEQDKLFLNTKETELEKKKDNADLIEKELFLKREIREKAQKEQEQISQKVAEKNKFKQEIEKTKLVISNKKESISNNVININQLKSQISELESLKFDESKIEEIESLIKLEKQEKQRLDEKNLEITSHINSLSLKNQENENIKNKLSKLEMCPTCLQDVDAVYKSNVFNKIDSDVSSNSNKIKELILEKKIVFEEIRKIEMKISEYQKKVQEMNFLKIKLQNLAEKHKRLEEIEKYNLSINKDLLFLQEQLENLQKTLFEFSKFDNIFEEKQRVLNEAIKQERLGEITVAELKKEIEFFSRQIEELKQRIDRSKEIKVKAEYLAKLEEWLSKKFTPLIAFIEKNVMIKLKIEFSQLFAEWFSVLVSDAFEIKLDDNFTPVIEQHDYEIDYAYLSGGERTAIALAYRLALNQVINSLLSKIKTKDLVILDEPTDGFSEQQLDKMREVLDQLNIAQLIIVSHEQKIEGFVENVIRFKKDNGVSQKV